MPNEAKDYEAIADYILGKGSEEPLSTMNAAVYLRANFPPQPESAQGKEREIGDGKPYLCMGASGCEYFEPASSAPSESIGVPADSAWQPDDPPSEPSVEEPKTPDIIERLLAACDGHPFAKIPWPHHLLHDAVAEITALRSRAPQSAQGGKI